MRVVGSEDLDRHLAIPALVRALHDAFRGGFAAPTRHHHHVGSGHGPGPVHLLMPAWTADAPRPGAYVGTKIVDVFPDNGRLGLPSEMGVNVLQSCETGAPLAVLDGTRLTHWRTAAVSALGADLLARPDAARLLLVGAGALAPVLARAHAAMRPLVEIAVWNHRPAGAERLATELRAAGLPAEAVTDLEGAARAADIISCATLSTAPLIRGAWLRPGQHLDLVGAFTMGMREADDDALRRARVVVDTPAALTEGGDVAIAVRDGVLPRDAVIDLGALCRGEAAGRRAPGDITLFKPVGTAIADLATAILAWERVSAA